MNTFNDQHIYVQATCPECKATYERPNAQYQIRSTEYLTKLQNCPNCSTETE